MSETESTPPTPPSTPTPPTDTPIGDELAASRQEVAPDATQAALPIEQAPATPEAVGAADSTTDPAAEQSGEDDEVKRALARTTHDGPGDEDPGESDWVSYATDGVEVDD